MSKYHAKKITVGGDTFDSKKEYRRFLELDLMNRSGKISNLRRQVKFVLIPAQRENGKLVERECAYYADFTYNQDGRYVVEDTKGVRTDAYRIKRKLMLYVHGIRVLET